LKALSEGKTKSSSVSKAKEINHLLDHPNEEPPAVGTPVFIIVLAE